MKPITLETPIKFNDPLPSKVDVVIIGGGVIGVSAALYLSEAGKRVLICEKGRIAGEQSSRNWGWIRQQGRDEAELPIAMRSVELWKDLDQRVNGQCGVKNTGVVYLTNKKHELEYFHQWIDIAKRHGLYSELLSQSDIQNCFSNQANHDWLGALRTPSDCKGEPWQAVPALAQLAHSLNTTIKENCAVRTLDIQADQIKGVFTEHGHVACEQVLVAAGAWSRLFLGAHDVKIPQLSVHANVASTDPIDQFTQSNCVDDQLALRPRLDGGYTLALADRHKFYIGPSAILSLKPWLHEIWQNLKNMDLTFVAPRGFPDAWTTQRKWNSNQITPFEKMRVLEPIPQHTAIKKMCDRFEKRFPQIGRPSISHSWAGLIDAMPDIVPIVDAIPNYNGLMLATGMSGHGFGIGPAFGQIIARRLMGKPDEFDLSRFRFDRFSDGSKLIHGPSL